MKFSFHPEALEEYTDAARYYAEQRDGLDLRFIESVENAIERLRRAPTSQRILEDDIRTCITRVFPYAILYTIEDDSILIVAVMHCHREPGYWRNRVRRK